MDLALFRDALVSEGAVVDAAAAPVAALAAPAAPALDLLPAEERLGLYEHS